MHCRNDATCLPGAEIHMGRCSHGLTSHSAAKLDVGVLFSTEPISTRRLKGHSIYKKGSLLARKFGSISVF